MNRIVENSICDNEYMFASPKPVKNPFNNLPFTKANLYTMYLGIDKMSVTKIPIIFYKYFLTEFNLKKFYEQNHALIRDKGIQDYLKNSETDELYEDVFDMLDYVNSYSRKRIHFDISDDCCKCCIVKIMKPYLNLYLTHKHSLNKYEIKQSFYELRYKLFKLFDHNPAFGRKLNVKLHTGLDNKVKFKTTYSLDHPNNYVPFNRDKYKKQHLDNSFVDGDDYPSYELSEYEPLREIGLQNHSRLYHFVQSASVQNISLNINPLTRTASNSSDSDDETVIPAYSAPTNESSEIEDGEILENSDRDNNDSAEVDYILDYTGDISANTIIPEDEEESLLNTLSELCDRLESDFELSDNIDNN